MFISLRTRPLHICEDFSIKGGHLQIQARCFAHVAELRSPGPEEPKGPLIGAAVLAWPWPGASVTLSAAEHVGCYGRDWLGWVLGIGAGRRLAGEAATGGDLELESTPGSQCQLLHLVFLPVK